MVENEVVINYKAGEFRLTDAKTKNKRYHNMQLLDSDTKEPIRILPACYRYMMAIFNS